MATFFRSSSVWVIDFRYDGRERRWLKALPAAQDAYRQAEQSLQQLYGSRAQLVQVRPATPEEDRDYIQGRLPHNALCPSGRAPRALPREPGADEISSEAPAAPRR